MADIESEIEAAAEFLTRKRGRVKAKWVVIPVALLWTIALAIVMAVGLRHRPQLVPFTASLYGCAGFFVHAYLVAWRSGSVIWRYSALCIAVGFYAVLCFLHADDATAWLIYSPDGVAARPHEPALFVAVVLNAIGALLLLIHGFFLGLGSRTPTPTELGLSTVPDPDEVPDTGGGESEEDDDEAPNTGGDESQNDDESGVTGTRRDGGLSPSIGDTEEPDPTQSPPEPSDDATAEPSPEGTPDSGQSDVDGDSEERDTGPQQSPSSRPTDEA